jgi:translation elongation factor EF-1beta
MGNKTELSFLTVPIFFGVKYAKVTREVAEDTAGEFDMKAADFSKELAS